MLHQRHELNVRIVHFLEIRHELFRQIVKIIRSAVVMIFPRPGMHFIDVQRSFEVIRAFLATAPKTVAPFEFRDRMDDRSIIWTLLKPHRIRIDLVDYSPSALLDLKLIQLPLFCIISQYAPHAVSVLFHRKRVFPIVKIPDKPNHLRIRCPNSKKITFLNSMRSKQLLGMIVFTGSKGFERIFEIKIRFFHKKSPFAKFDQQYLLITSLMTSYHSCIKIS